jgi:hypothetical protein
MHNTDTESCEYQAQFIVLEVEIGIYESDFPDDLRQVLRKITNTFKIG